VILRRSRLLFLTALISGNIFAAPIDWNGTLVFDSNIIKDFRRTGDSCTAANGSQCIDEEENNARFQSMILKLNPTIIVNDGVTIEGEISTGNVRTSLLGNSTNIDTDNDGSNNDTNAAFAQTAGSNLTLNQLYAKLIADTALYRIGRFSKHYGLGAVVNGGEKVTDRFFTAYEGIEAKLSLGKFKLTPMWAKLHTSDNPNGRYDSYETSIDAMYDDPNKNMKFGVYYAQREVQSNDKLYNAGSQNVTLIDVFISKEWEDFKLALEIPMLTGEVNNLYGTTDADFDANAYILESTYKLNPKWNIGLNAGLVKGDDATTGSFEGMYLNPNYQLGKVMFKYNYHGFNKASQYDVFNSSIVNTTYAQLFAHYTSGEWTWKLSALWAKANEVASKGEDFYDHENNAVVTNANDDQSDDLGYELDIEFDYQWNPTVVFSGHLGYHFVGDYYSFQNSSSETLGLSNVMSTGMQLAIKF
jgi:hypothetical protein